MTTPPDRSSSGGSAATPPQATAREGAAKKRHTVEQPRSVEQTSVDETLDEALAETFPASDPLAVTPRRAGIGDRKVDANPRDDRPRDDRLPPASPPPHMRRTWN